MSDTTEILSRANMEFLYQLEQHMVFHVLLFYKSMGILFTQM